MKKLYLTIFIGLMLTLVMNTSGFAQNNRNFQLAVRLMQQQKYGEALPILEELHAQNPATYVYADRFISCLIQLKQYDRGLEIAQKYTDNQDVSYQAQIRIGELYHFKGEVDKALKIWKANIATYPRKTQLYMNTARTMINRQEFMEAVSVYKQARKEFKNEQFFINEIANAYMRAGEYELAIQEWLNLLQASPNQLSFIQRSLLRYNDPLLYDITIIELDDRIRELSVSNTAYKTFFNFQVWLLQENKLYRRALTTAKEYERRTESYNYTLFNLGRQLITNNEFELAEQAFSFYSQTAKGEVRWRALEELSATYSAWAKYIDDYNLDFTQKRDSLFQLATVMLDSIEAETTTYSNRARVQQKRAEIALDHIFDLEKAQASLTKLKSYSGNQNSPEISYLEGRIHLAKKEFSQARVHFTQANKQARIGSLAEKTRYFLALTDFYAGDYEFAEIQLKSLGRQSTSYYANNALELRLWLQQGLSADSTGRNLSLFADAVFKQNNGDSENAAALFLAIIEDPDVVALKDDAMLFFVESKHINPVSKFERLSNFLTEITHSPLKEKLMWERAKLAEQLPHYTTNTNCKTGADCVSSNQNSLLENWNTTAQDIYEELILRYPQGFYAPYARERLSELPNTNS